MKNFKFLVVLVLSLFVCMSNVSADLCDTTHIKQLKALAGQVEVTHEYVDQSQFEDSDFVVVNAYRVFANLLSDELYMVFEDRNYYYSDAKDGVLTFDVLSGRFKAEIRSKQCAGYLLKKVNIDLPDFNTFSIKEECKKLEEYNLDVCDPWYQGKLTDEIFYQKVSEYLPDNEGDIFKKIWNFISGNYLIVGAGCLGVLLIIIFIIVYRKRSVLE